jgi:hypothetical protein
MKSLRLSGGWWATCERAGQPPTWPEAAAACAACPGSSSSGRLRWPPAAAAGAAGAARAAAQPPQGPGLQAGDTRHELQRRLGKQPAVACTMRSAAAVHRTRHALQEGEDAVWKRGQARLRRCRHRRQRGLGKEVARRIRGQQQERQPAAGRGVQPDAADACGGTPPSQCRSPSAGQCVWLRQLSRQAHLAGAPQGLASRPAAGCSPERVATACRLQRRPPSCGCWLAPATIRAAADAAAGLPAAGGTPVPAGRCRNPAAAGSSPAGRQARPFTSSAWRHAACETRAQPTSTTMAAGPYGMASLPAWTTAAGCQVATPSTLLQ